jgi:hypothetical protein
MAKEKCDCGKDAVWLYMPGYSNGINPFHCDDCVMDDDNKIGCSCNWHYSKPQEGLPQDLPEGIEGIDWAWVEHAGDEYIDKITKEEGFWIHLDERGRPSPCVEYDYDENGFDFSDLDSKDDEHDSKN